MNTLNELIYYCNEQEPAGALMLTGEWGCGKTYLIDKELTDALAASHILVRVSLFGVDSVDTLHTAVKKAWVTACGSLFGKLKDHEKVLKVGKTLVSAAGTVAANFIPIIKDITETALSIDPLDYITITNVVGDDEHKKRVVLVFDDLERCKLDTVDVLGCINEYCENQHFHTIIVANEEKISDEDSTKEGAISYDKIKEKIVARTVKHKPDYGKVVRAVVEGMQGENDAYKQFLQENEQLTVSVFESDPLPAHSEGDADVRPTEKPHNIRSLKCALRDFYRVYQGLSNSGIPNIDRHLYSFIAYTLAAKSGIAKEGEYGYYFSDQDVERLYPLFNSLTLLESARNWIIKGEWDEEAFNKEIESLTKQTKAREPKDILRTTYFNYLEDGDIQSGFSELLEDCYRGDLSLNEYVVFITNCRFLREFDIEPPTAVDWNKVCEGIQIRFERNITAEDDEGHLYSNISPDTRSQYTAEELKAYDMIDAFQSSGQVFLMSNERKFIDALRKEGVMAFIAFQNKLLNRFTEEMAEATAYCFERSGPADKASFPGFFKGMWESVCRRQGLDISTTREGLQKLVGLLQSLEEQYIKEGSKIASVHTKAFTAVVGNLIEIVGKRDAKEAGRE